jgi:DNA adenine methylase
MSRPPKYHAPIQASFDDVLTAIADENKPTFREVIARPFVKWAGGKRSILPELIARMPRAYKTYCEPFLGGGALFFAVRPESAYLSDINFPLIVTFRAVRDDVETIIANLKIHAAKHCKEYYLRARERFSREKDATKIGALLVYLNKTCYNGLFRVNKEGGFNVPIGSYDEPGILDEENLRACSKALKTAEIVQHPFAQVPIAKENFYYLDPPYHKTFDGYDSSRFGDKDHRRLAEFCHALDKAGCFFMVSNSDNTFVRSLYRAFKIEQIQGARFVSCKPQQRGRYNELIIRNYE